MPKQQSQGLLLHCLEVPGPGPVLKISSMSWGKGTPSHPTCEAPRSPLSHSAPLTVPGAAENGPAGEHPVEVCIPPARRGRSRGGEEELVWRASPFTIRGCLSCPGEALFLTGSGTWGPEARLFCQCHDKTQISGLGG